MASPQPASPRPPDDDGADNDDDVAAVPVEADEVCGRKGIFFCSTRPHDALFFQRPPPPPPPLHPQPTGPTTWDDVVADEAAHVALRVVTAMMPRTDGGGAPVSVVCVCEERVVAVMLVQ